MKVLHINCNYMGSLLHQNMMETLIEKGVNNRVFVPLKTLNNHPVKPKEYVTPVVCFKTINTADTKDAEKLYKVSCHQEYKWSTKTSIEGWSYTGNKRLLN